MMSHTTKFLLSLSLGAMIAIAFNAEVHAADKTQEFDIRHKACLEQIAVDAEIAYEDAMVWKDDGGGRRAKHCEAMALFALGHTEEAAYRLEKLAATNLGGSTEMRVDFYAESSNFWLMSEEPRKAYEVATAGLKLAKDDVELRISRARAYALLGRYEYAETDLTSALAFKPLHADALRYRADARFNQDDLEGAKTDIERSLTADPTKVETALLRGKINEALRLAELADKGAK